MRIDVFLSLCLPGQSKPSTLCRDRAVSGLGDRGVMHPVLFSSRDFFGYDCVYVQGPPFCFWET